MSDDGEGLSEMSDGSVRLSYSSYLYFRVVVRAKHLGELSNLMAPDEFQNLGFAENDRNPGTEVSAEPKVRKTEHNITNGS